VLTASCSQAAGPWFVEGAEAAGIDFHHVSSLERRYYFPEIMSGGVGLLDFDKDGWLDVYLVQGGDLVIDVDLPVNRLYRNQGDGTFADVTETAGVGDPGYGMGCACADYDGDGWTDLYVTNVGANRLYRNLGNGRFLDVTEEARVGDAGFGASAAFADYDLDGDLDLFVANNIVWTREAEIHCEGAMGLDDYCHPNNYEAPAPDTLFHNDGAGSFSDVSESAGLREAYGNGLGVVASDLNGDGWPDFYVANDSLPNQLWINDGNGRFQDRAAMTGSALSGEGIAEAGMGLQAIDVENDGDRDLFITHMRNQSNTFYSNEGRHFEDSTARLGLSVPSQPFTGFGVGFVDFDGDSALDLFVANGRVTIAQPFPDESDYYAEENQLFEQGPTGGFLEVMPRGGVAKPLAETSRGAAFGDLDNDGDVDVLVVNRDARVHLLWNVVGSRRAWIGFSLLSAKGTDALGAVVAVVSGGHVQYREVNPGYSYCSSNDPRVLFGLGRSARVEAVRVRWPTGEEEAFGPFTEGAYYELRQGSAR